MKKRCVYTVLFGNYESLNEQNIAKESNIDFLCFTDNQDLKSKTWKIIYTNPILPRDAVRSSRIVKICPHRYLADYDESLYIDNSIQLQVKPEFIFSDLLESSIDFVLMKHSFRETVLDEFYEVNRLNYDYADRIIEQMNDYSVTSPQIFKQKPYWGGFLLRRHNVPLIIQAMEDWNSQVLRYSRRDQLSLNYIIDKYNLTINALDIDIFASIYHRWPISDRLAPRTVINDSKQVEFHNSILMDLKQEIVDYHQQFQRLESQLVESETAMREKERQILTLQKKIENSIDENKEINEKLNKAEFELNEIKVSKVYRAALQFRKARLIALPKNSKREQLMRYVWNFLRGR